MLRGAHVASSFGATHAAGGAMRRSRDSISTAPRERRLGHAEPGWLLVDEPSENVLIYRGTWIYFGGSSCNFRRPTEARAREE